LDKALESVTIDSDFVKASLLRALERFELAAAMMPPQQPSLLAVVHHQLARVVGFIATIEGSSEKWAEVEKHYRLAIRNSSRSGDRIGAGVSEYGLARHLLSGGDLAGALHEVNAALDLLQASGEGGKVYNDAASNLLDEIYTQL
jgi:hypothetical protein